ncbi:MAG: tetratricopeptide repeat protein [Candidatus Thorarchaeota archaeon]
MEPLGTITMCFPYVDEKSRNTLELVMKEAENYGDFTEKLCDKIITDQSSPLLEYLAISFAYWVENYNLIDKLEAAGKVSDLAKPLFLHVKVNRGTNISWDEVRASLTTALDMSPNDWISSHLYLTWRMSTQYFFSEADVEIWPLDTIAAAVKDNSELSFFESHLLWIEAWTLVRENDNKAAIANFRRVLAIARKFDDRVYAACTLGILANLIRQSDIKQAIDILLTTRELSEELGYFVQIGYIQQSMGQIMGMRGEYDAAIDYHCEFRKYQVALSHPTNGVDSLIAFYYNMSGDGNRALDRVKRSISPENAPHRQLAYTRAQQAWALINLERYDEAKEVIDICHTHALKSGDVNHVNWYYMVEGLLDKAENRFENAQMNFQRVLDFMENSPTPLFQNICLLNLTEMEIDMLEDTSLHEKQDLSGNWMEKLEKYVQDNDFPGIAAQSIILKAKLRYRQGKYDDAKKILKEVQKTAKTPSMRYLKDIMIAKFPDVIVT